MPYVGKKPADIIATAVDTTTGTFSGDIDASTVNATGDTAAGDNAAIGFTSAEGLILTGQGSTSDITVKNDADATVFTVPTGTDDILFPDNAKAMFGAGSDLQIYHDGTHSYVSDEGTGNLILRGSNELLLGTTAGEDILKGTTDGDVKIYHNNVEKFATTSGGVTVTGDIANASGDMAIDVAGDLIIDVDGEEIFLKDDGTHFGGFKNVSFDFVVKSVVQDKDLIFQGNDGGSGIEIARFDVSEAALVLRDGGGSQSNNGRIDIKTSGSTYNLIALQTTRSATGTNFIEFFNSSAAVAGAINHNGSTTVNFSTSSDYRLKENVTYDFDATSRLKQLKPARFNFKEEPNTTIDGFIAHEAQEVVPIAVSGTKDEIKKWNKEEIEGGFAPDGTSEGDNKLDDSGNPIPKYQGIDNSHLVPLLTKALQEQQATIEALTARIVTLENA